MRDFRFSHDSFHGYIREGAVMSFKYTDILEVCTAFIIRALLEAVHTSGTLG
jgi:hypothetical protein